MARSLFLLLFLTVLGGAAGAQQLSQSSLFFLDPAQFNPAYAGLDNSLSITATYRAQWTGLEGQPTTQRLSAHLPVYFLNSGFGIEGERDELGARSLTRLGASWSYQLVRPSAVWSLGLSARMMQLSLDGRALRTPDGDYGDGVIIHDDPQLPDGQVDNSSLSLAAGVYYQSEWLEGGLSVRNLNGPVVQFPGFDYNLARQYHGYLRARFDVLSDFDVSPILSVYSDGTQHQTNAGALIRYRENAFGGASYRGYNGPTGDAVVLMAGINVSDKIRIAYAYDLTLSDLRTAQDGSHEFTVKYNLGKRIGAGVPPPVIYNPRTKLE